MEMVPRITKARSPEYVETRDDTTDPIRHVGNVPFGYDGKQTYLKSMLQVPTITEMSPRLIGSIQSYDILWRWFRELRKLDQPEYVKTGDDTTDPIWHVGNVPFSYDGKQTYLKNVLQVPTITKNLVSLGQIVEQGMQVRFNNEGCFIEKESQLVVHGRKKGRMFILKWN